MRAGIVRTGDVCISVHALNESSMMTGVIVLALLGSYKRAEIALVFFWPIAGSVSRDLHSRGFGYPVARLVVPIFIGTNGVAFLVV